MKLYVRMPKSLKQYYKLELKSYHYEYLIGNLDSAWNHLERAHVLGQKYPFEHSFVHWKMLFYGFKIKSFKEIIGQIPRLLIGGVKSFVGKIPIGNTGGANVPPLKPLPIEKDIREIFIKVGL
ncbi:DUF3703 domain-containing protein [Aquimarina sediminis]|uniref:DUF3703 domain-containing protein n=1 Tax=Aquimarina sediminis TaxID=2070536 RepID=UPI000CA0565C|nr:DUF3703 domain-containing protein [Aquimarina sediminis]